MTNYRPPGTKRNSRVRTDEPMNGCMTLALLSHVLRVAGKRRGQDLDGDVSSEVLIPLKCNF